MAANASVTLQRIAKKCGLKQEDIEDAYPCTSLQAGLLAASLHGVADYTSTFVFKLSSSHHRPDSVKVAFEALYDRTPILRTRFLETKGIFLQVITSSPITWLEYDNLEEYLEVDRKVDFELGSNLARFAWISNDDGHSYMVWTLHHALYDEWSVSLLFDDISKLASMPEPALEARKRPAFSKFIKSLNNIDQAASGSFWNEHLAQLDQCRPVCPKAKNSFQTSDQLEVSCPFTMASSVYQQSTIVISAWALMISKLSGSDTVTFGNIVNGRTADVPGITDMCGPTMTTVPYVIRIPYDSTVEAFMKQLDRIRSDILPFEQTGLKEYRKAIGAAGFETLLSIRSSQPIDSDRDNGPEVRPQTTGKRDMRHPCCLFLDTSFDSNACLLKASFDAGVVDSDKLKLTLQKFSSCLKTLSESLHQNLREFSNSLQFPTSIERDLAEHTSYETPDEEDVPLNSDILEKVLKVIRNVGPLQDNIGVRPDTTLRELGFDSLYTVVLARRLSDIFHTSVPFKNIVGLRKTVSDIAKMVQRTVQGKRESDSRTTNIPLMAIAEAHAKSLRAIKPPSTTANRSNGVLLTGATGYLGIEILRQCLSLNEDMLILPVRCSKAAEGLERVRHTAKIAKWQESELAMLDHRLQIWPSDLGAAELGLNTEQVTQLQQVHTIIHNGAKVDFLPDYHDLEKTNVLSTLFLLSQNLKSAVRPSFIYVTGGRSCPLGPDIDLAATASRLSAANGYAQTKFTSELLVQHAQEACNDTGRDAKMTIVHPGIVIGNECTGVANTDDFIWRYVAASIRMRAYVPAVPTKREWVNVTTMDSVASATVSAITAEQGRSTVERRLVLSGMSVARFWEIVIETLGEDELHLEPVSEWEWLRILEEDLEKKGMSHPLFSLSQMLLQGYMKGIGGLGPCPEKEMAAQETLSAERAVAANVRYLRDVGFFSREDGERLSADVFGRTK